MFSSPRKRGGADAFENDPSFRSKGTVGRSTASCFKAAAVLNLLVRTTAVNLVHVVLNLDLHTSTGTADAE
jgi:hypothetical protein